MQQLKKNGVYPAHVLSSSWHRGGAGDFIVSQIGIFPGLGQKRNQKDDIEWTFRV